MGASRVAGVGAAGLVLAGVVLAGATGVVSASLLGSGSGGGSGPFGVAGSGGTGGVGGGTGGLVPTTAAISRIPPPLLTLYEAAATTCSGLPWTVLAAIGTVESGNGTSTLPGVHSGSNFAGAEGPMQFEPATFAAYDQPPPPGGAVPPSPYDPTDAVYAAARMLCVNGASGGADLSAAVYAYNHSNAYVTRVLSLAQSYGTVPASTAGVGLVGPGSAGANAAVWALAQVGTPYIWGGETPGVGFDCSGLSQAAYKVAGISIPRVAQDQYDAGPHLAAGTTLEPGDLVFFGSGPTDVGHVGLYLGVQAGRTMMVDAPHTGASVRIEAFPATIGAAWGDEEFVGATRPDA
jgi:hypothetical protein